MCFCVCVLKVERKGEFMYGGVCVLFVCTVLSENERFVCMCKGLEKYISLSLCLCVFVYECMCKYFKKRIVNVCVF